MKAKKSPHTFTEQVSNAAKTTATKHVTGSTSAGPKVNVQSSLYKK